MLRAGVLTGDGAAALVVVDGLMGQAPRALTPYVSGRDLLGSELRCWRQHRGLSLARLAASVFASADLLAKIEKADRVASLDLIERCDAAMDTGGALARLWRFVDHQVAQAPVPASSGSLRITFTAEVVAAGLVEADPLPAAVTPGGARLYALPGGRGGSGMDGMDRRQAWQV